jgi:hypothetical protein
MCFERCLAHFSRERFGFAEASQKGPFFGDDSGVPKLLDTVEKLVGRIALERLAKSRLSLTVIYDLIDPNYAHILAHTGAHWT